MVHIGTGVYGGVWLFGHVYYYRAGVVPGILRSYFFPYQVYLFVYGVGIGRQFIQRVGFGFLFGFYASGQV